MKLEIIGFNIESCILAQTAGADRIELCDNPGEGGTTASYGFIKAARQALKIELYPIIRPRGGDFLYSDAEFDIMKDDVRICKKLGCDGIVTGILNPDGTVDKERCLVLIKLAYPMGVTFHRAFDRTVDPLQALEDIIELGFERILTSGQKQSALEGAELIARLIEKGEDRVIIMPGSGVRSDNLHTLAEKTKATEFHASVRVSRAGNMQFKNKSLESALQSISVDENEVRKLRELLYMLE